MPTTMDIDLRPETVSKLEVAAWASEWNADVDDLHMSEDADDVAASRQALANGEFIPYDEIARKLGLK